MRWVAGVCLFAALLPVSSLHAQGTGRIAGTVTTETGQPLPGANVVVVGTNIGTLSSEDGRYVIPGVPVGMHQVQASLIGYASQTVTVRVEAGQTAAADFRLSQQAIALDEIVAVGYGTQRRRDVTGAVASVRSEEIRQIATPSVGEALKGRAPGLDIRTTGYRPGDNPTIRVRGVRSLEASNDPLIVVDGVAISGGLQDINPNIIQSIEVLKDASATAIYGSRAANGVILITTDKGQQAGRTRITYDTRLGIQKIRKYLEVFSGPEFAQFRRDAARSDNLYPCPIDQACEEGDRLIFNEYELDGLLNGVSEDYQRLISRDGMLQDHQLRITGGNENTRFAISGNFLDEKGVTKGTEFVRRGVNASLDHTAGRFRAGISAYVSNSTQNLGRGNGLWGEAITINPLGRAYLPDGSINTAPTNDAQMWNPLADIEHWKRESQRTRTFGNAYLAYELFPGVTLQTTFGADLLFRREGEFVGAQTDTYRGSSNRAWVERFQTFNYVSTTQLQVDRQLTDAHRVNATFLYEIQRESSDRSRADVSNLPYEYQLFHNVGTGAIVNGVSSNYSEWTLRSVMGRINYTLLDRYYLTLTGRQDCSSRLAPGKKCSFFPSVGVKWRLSDEGFMQGQTLFSDLSLRGGYGLTGNTAIAPYQTQGSLARTSYSFGGAGAYGFRPAELANPDLEWEKTAKLDVGLEFGLFGQRISGVIDAYLENTYDLLMERQLPATSGFSSVLQNVGETRNRGIEVGISTVNLDGWKGIRWRTDLVFSMNRNEIVSLYGGKEDDPGNWWFIGKPIRVWYEYEFAGIWQLEDSALARSYNRRPGDIRVVDQNGDGRITQDADRVIIGRHPEFPAWTGSLTNRFEFGAFDLSALITARWGYTIRDATWPGQMSSRYNQPKMNYWTPTNPSNEFPRPYRNTEGAVDAGAVQFFDGSHWRVRNITLGYRVPTPLLARLGPGASMRIYFQAQDPFVFTDYPGFDPEGTSNTDEDSTNYGRTEAGVPSYRSFVVGASISF